MTPDGAATFFLLLNLCGLGGCAALFTRGVTRSTPEDSSTPVPNTVKVIQRRFLCVFALVTSAEYVQSSYLFKLYSYYGLGKGEIGLLFVVGPIAAAIIGTVLAGLADTLGRKRLCSLFCLLFAVGAGSKQLASYSLILAARVGEAAAGSILLTCFEAWVVYELERNTGNGTRARAITETLCLMSGSVSLLRLFWSLATPQIIQVWNYLAPFNIASGLCAVALLGIYFSFGENHGRNLSSVDAAKNEAGPEKPSFVDKAVAAFAQFGVGWMVLTSSKKIYLVGIMQTCIDTGLYILMLSWVPHLEYAAGDSTVHENLIFASFMLSQALGTALFYLLQQPLAIPGTNFKLNPLPSNLIVTGSQAASLASACLLALAPRSPFVVVLAFSIMQMSAGVASPALAYLRALHIPNEVRVIVMNFLRIPFLGAQVLVLLNLGHMAFASIAMTYISLGGVSLVAQYLIQDKQSIAVAEPNAP